MLPLIILTGPTGSMKSRTAAALAERLDSEIINADSMQVYKYFDIGTDKPSPEIRQKIAHHLIDILEPDQEFNAFDFKVRAVRHTRELLQREKIPLMVGGTGLYIKVFTEDYECAVQISPQVRERVQSEMKEKGVLTLHQELTRVDPDSAANIKVTDWLRIERALSVFLETGKKMSDYHEAETPARHQFPISTFRLEWDRKELYANINQRVERMIESGLVEEVKHLLKSGYSKILKPFQSIGYRQIVNHLEGRMNLDRAIYEIKRETRHYAKRQVTWFKKIPNVIPVPATSSDTPETLRDKILSLMPKATALLLLLAVLTGFQTPAGARDSKSIQAGVTLFKEGKYSKAENSFRAVRNSTSNDMEKKRALFLLAHAYNAQNEDDNALKTFQAVLKEYPEIEDYIRLEMARIYHKLNLNSIALEQLDALLKITPNTLLYPQAQLLRAEIQTKMGKIEPAIQTLQTAIKKISRSPSINGFKSQLPEIIFQQGKLQNESGQKKEAFHLFQDLYIRFPNHPLTEKAYLEMKQLSSRKDISKTSLNLEEHGTRIHGLLDGVRYLQVVDEINKLLQTQPPLPSRFYFFLAKAYKGLRERNQSIRTLKTYLKLYTKHYRVQEARFAIGRHLWNLGRDGEGIRYFEKILRQDKSSQWAIKSLFILGRIYENTKQTAKALKQYQYLVDRYGKDEYAQQAGWRRGWIHYLKGDYQKAFDLFHESSGRFPYGLYIEANLFWKAKSAETLGRRESAVEIYNDLQTRFPFSYYGIRAGEKLDSPAKVNKQPAVIKTSFTPDKEPPVNLNRKLSREERFHHLRAVEMAEMGFYENARLEIRQLEKTVRKTFPGIMWLSSLYNRAQSFGETLQLLHLYKDFKTKKNEKDLSERFWKLFYPPAYDGIIQENSQTHRIDPFFVKSLIRQESLFDTRSLSPAGARGLMQIMPETGRRLYSSTAEKKPFDKDFLYNPNLNIQLGIKYLGQLNRKFGSNGAHILISYNAGPQILKKWLKRFEDMNDTDVFIESIPYPETRKYVKFVLRNQGAYKRLYQNDVNPGGKN